MDLLVTTQTTAAGITITVTGEVDVSCADTLRNALVAALETKAAHITVDLSAVTYIDSTGIGVLVGALIRLPSNLPRLPLRILKRMLRAYFLCLV